VKITPTNFQHSATSAAGEKNKATTVRAALLVLSMVAVAVAGCGAGRIDFFLRSGTYESVVKEVRKIDLTPGVDHVLRVEKPWQYNTLRPAPGEFADRGEGVGMVWASTTPGGALTVVLQISDLGHAGVDGYAFSDEPIDITVDADGYQWAELPGYIELVRVQVDESWWAVYFNLD